MRWWRPRAAPADPARWVVVDVEASGLDARRDDLLAIAALAVRVDGPVPVIVPGDSFEAVLRPSAPRLARDTILLHGLGVGQQRQGLPMARAMTGFRHWVGASPLVGWHVGFDRALIERAASGLPGGGWAAHWLDLEPIAAVVAPGANDGRGRSLDDELARHRIPCRHRHRAAADALATAELLQRLWPPLRVACAGRVDLAAAARVAAARRWVAG